MSYPYFKPHIHQDDLVEHFSISSEDNDLLDRLKKSGNRLGFLVLLKTFQFLGYSPRKKADVPSAIIEWIAHHIGVPSELFHTYHWKSRVWDHHLALIREHTGFRPCEPGDYLALQKWLIDDGNECVSRKHLFAAAVKRCRECKWELPTESELRRLVYSARKTFWDTLYQNVCARIEPHIKERLDLIVEPLDDDVTKYEWIKAPPGPLGMKTILEELEKLRSIREYHIAPAVYFCGYSHKILKSLKDRARGEDAFQIRRHPPEVRYTLLAALLHTRGMEITDHIVRLFLELIHRVEKKADKAMEKRLIEDIKKVYGKSHILYRVARAATQHPDETIRDAIFPVVKEDVLHRLVEESELIEPGYEVSRTRIMHKKYSSSYRRMVKPVLDTLVFRSHNPAHASLLTGIELMHRYLDRRHVYYPETETIPDDILTGIWRKIGMEESSQGSRVSTKHFELCVLRKLERALKCKEIWVEGAYRFRNPDEDLPADWEDRRVEYYHMRGAPLNADEFIEPLKKEMYAGLEHFNSFLNRARDVAIFHPGGGEKGVLLIPKLQKRPERPLIQEVKGGVLKKWGILDLIDILLEADRRVDFSRFFQTSGQRQVLTKEEVRTRLLLVIFSLGTNMGLTRIHSAARPSCSYDDLRYFRSRFLTTEALREAIAALVNQILEIRNPAIWGKGTACASDGKHLGAWEQNLVAEWNPHYGKRGVMAYWHVDTNATCIYSQLKTCSSSEVAAMIEGLVRHDTEMRVESNFVDSHGQSEVAFAFCRFLGIELMPRLKRIKHEHLYLPEKGFGAHLPHLAGVLTRPIRWELIGEQYDEMMRHVAAITEETAPIESILRRFNSYNRTHPTYRAFTELGKALKTIFLCLYLTHPEMREEIHEGINIIENWNSCIDFIFYGRKTEFQTNDPATQELAVLCLHLLQNALILVNTLLIEKIIDEHGFINRMEPEDFRALTPLFTSNINPYGDFDLNLYKPSILEVA